jgi:hypothetical protein
MPKNIHANKQSVRLGVLDCKDGLCFALLDEDFVPVTSDNAASSKQNEC